MSLVSAPRGGAPVLGALVVYLVAAIPRIRPDNMDVIPDRCDSRIEGIKPGGAAEAAEPDVGAPGASAVGGALIIHLGAPITSVKPDGMDAIPRKLLYVDLGKPQGHW